jgi:hypothetical protein
MKKIILILGICCLLATTPIMTAMAHDPQKTTPTLYNQLPFKTESSVTLDDPPEWANGNFSGVWGVTILGIPTDPLGWIDGYYEEIGLGRLAAEFAEFGETNATGGLLGYMLWIFFLGGVGSLATGNGTYVSGIGVANETHYYLRLNAIIGPSYYIHVAYTRFE